MSEQPTVTVKTITEDIRCSQCNYQLTTLSPDANCPECGNSVKQSLAEHYFTSQKQLITVLFRLLMLYCFIVYVFPNLSEMIIGLVVVLIQQQSISLIEAAFFIGSIVLKATALILAFYFAPPIVSRFFKPKGLFTTNPNLTAEHLLSIGVALLGLYITAAGTIHLLQALLNIFPYRFTMGPSVVTSWSSPNPYSEYMQLIPHMIQIVIGIAMVCGRNGLSKFVHKLRTAGTNQ